MFDAINTDLDADPTTRERPLRKPDHGHVSCGLAEHQPALRAFALKLCGRPAQADDLVQETFARALASADGFTAGTDLRAWLFTILRNTFTSDLRKKSREVEDVDEARALRLVSAPAQEAAADLSATRHAMRGLPMTQRAALTLVAVHGLSVAEAADRLDVAPGTVKSRVSRAREALVDGLRLDGVDELFDHGSASVAEVAEGRAGARRTH